MVANVGQRVMLVLTADLEQLASDLGERRERGQVGLDRHPTAPRSPEVAFEHQAFVFKLESELGQTRRELLADAAAHGKLRLDASNLVTVADQLDSTPTTAQQCERIDD